jgi:cyclopropane-fatty-acyl-phospholipid synthase
MGVKAASIRFVERTPLPDAITRPAIKALVADTSRKLAAKPSTATRAFANDMWDRPIAVHTPSDAQHYEIPAHFFALVLGPARKYSCCYYPGEDTTLAEAEQHALAETSTHARLAEGQSILELGCGWGSLSLWLASQFPQSQTLAVTDQQSQRLFIEQEISDRGLDNLRVITADVNTFEPGATFDRVVSIETFEQVPNWPALLGRIHSWLKPDGLFFMHVFSHCRVPYRLNHRDESHWIGKHFFAGGIMPSHDLIREFSECFEVERDWRWSGCHYQRTAEDWLLNFDRHKTPIGRVLRSVYGEEAQLWQRRWRLFFLATAGMFGHRRGEEWGVSHYLLRPTQ